MTVICHLVLVTTASWLACNLCSRAQGHSVQDVAPLLAGRRQRVNVYAWCQASCGDAAHHMAMSVTVWLSRDVGRFLCFVLIRYF